MTFYLNFVRQIEKSSRFSEPFCLKFMSSNYARTLSLFFACCCAQLHGTPFSEPCTHKQLFFTKCEESNVEINCSSSILHKPV